MVNTKHFDNCIVEQSMINGLKTNLKDAIEYAGAKVSKSECLWKYPEIIRDNLIAKSINNINLLGKDVINITKEHDNNNEIIYNISTIYDTNNIERPNYALPSDSWGDSISINTIFNDLFKNILPAVRGVYAGDMIVTSNDGIDNEWYNNLFDKKGCKHDLQPNSKYLRLYLTCQAEPLYILINSTITDVTGSYNIKSSDTVNLIIDNTNTLSAHISCITTEQINDIY